MKDFYFFIPLQLIWKIEIYEEINFLGKRKGLSQNHQKINW